MGLAKPHCYKLEIEEKGFIIITDLVYPGMFYKHHCHSFIKGNCAFPDLRYGEEDSISPSTQICADT